MTVIGECMDKSKSEVKFIIRHNGRSYEATISGDNEALELFNKVIQVGSLNYTE